MAGACVGVAPLEGAAEGDVEPLRAAADGEEGEIVVERILDEVGFHLVPLGGVAPHFDEVIAACEEEAADGGEEGGCGGEVVGEEERQEARRCEKGEPRLLEAVPVGVDAEGDADHRSTRVVRLAQSIERSSARRQVL